MLCCLYVSYGFRCNAGEQRKRGLMVFERWFVLRHVSALSVLVLVGCAAVGPDYVPPKLSDRDVPSQWTSHPDTAPMTMDAPKEPWWTELSDPALNRLVDDAMVASPTLEAAMARLAQSGAGMKQVNASGLPSVGGSAGGERGNSDGRYGNAWLSTNASWEIDLFGAVRRGREGAVARVAAQRATLADARLTLSADVTDAYLNYRACQSQLELSDADVKSREATEKTTADSISVGFTAPYQGIRSTASVAEAKTSLAATRARCDQMENLLTRLTGIARPKLMEILAEKPTGIERLPVPKHFSVGVPKEALMHRPDVRSAEKKVAAASADIGLAEADRYPRVTLNGSFGYEVDKSGSSGALSYGTWSLGPSVSLPIFDGGRRKAAVEKAKAQYDESIANFRSTVRNAVQDIEDALTRYAAAHQRAENARKSAEQYEHFYDAVDARYREGASNLLELEDARRSMLGAQQTLLSVQLERLQAWVALNRASGGAAEYEKEQTAAEPVEKSSMAQTF